MEIARRKQQAWTIRVLIVVVVATLGTLMVSRAGALECPDGWTEWVGGAEGAWNTATNWSAGVVPDADTDVCIGEGATVSVTNGSARSLLSAGNLVISSQLALGAESTIAGDVTATGSLLAPTDVSLTLGGTTTWSSSLSGAVVNDGLLVATGTTTKSFTGSLLNRGTVRHEGNGGLSLATGVAVINEGSWEHAAGGSLTGFGGTFRNVGSYTRTTATGTSTVSPALTNEGTIVGQTGTLTFQSVAALDGGTIDVAAPAQVNLQGQSAVLEGDITALGTGTLRFAGSWQLDTEAPVSLQAPAAQDLVQLAASVTTTDGDLTLHGRNDLQSSGFTGSGTVTNLGTLRLTGLSSKTIEGDLVNEGEVVVEGAGGIASAFATRGEIRNEGTWEYQVQSAFGGGGTFVNRGTLAKTGGTAMTISPDVTNEGEISVEVGTLTLQNVARLDGGGLEAVGGRS
jgi:fibronectin-binding autotransporter adhesin